VQGKSINGEKKNLKNLEEKCKKTNLMNKLIEELKILLKTTIHKS
jgi:hypothetical protein